MNNYTGIPETVKKSYSYRLTAKSLLIIIACALASTFIVFFSLYREPAKSYAENYVIIAELRRQLLNRAAVIYLVTSIFILIGVAVITLLYSHRVAGPLYRLGIFARTIAAGDLSGEVRLRQHDVIHPMADDLNGIVKKYRDILGQLEVMTGEMKGDASAAHGEPAPYSPDRMLEKTEEMKELLSRIKL
jgi:methyl-accepting chemotaxis protein